MLLKEHLQKFFLVFTNFKEYILLPSLILKIQAQRKILRKLFSSSLVVINKAQNLDKSSHF